MNILEFKAKKQAGQKLTMLTCYDYTSARLMAETDVDSILVGDSLAMTMYGHNSTLPATTEIMALHVAAVAKGAPKKLIIGDMPFLSFRKGLSESMTAVEKIMQAGAHAVKLEGVAGNEDLIRHIVESGVPVVGHLGLTPQSVHGLGGFKVQARDRENAERLMAAALKLEELGCFAVVLECIPSKVAEEVTSRLQIPTVGIGAGPHTDGQVLVMQDMLGLNPDFRPKFVRCYLDGQAVLRRAFQKYCDDVRTGNFPGPEESYQ